MSNWKEKQHFACIVELGDESMTIKENSGKGNIEGFEVVMISNGVTWWNKGAIVIMSIVVENFAVHWKVGYLHKKALLE